MYDSLSHIVSAAIEKGFELIVGGDFKSQLGVGMRGTMFLEFAAVFGLNITNDKDDYTMERDWTFCNYTGIKRRLDYILCESKPDRAGAGRG